MSLLHLKIQVLNPKRESISDLQSSSYIVVSLGARLPLKSIETTTNHSPLPPQIALITILYIVKKSLDSQIAYKMTTQL